MTTENVTHGGLTDAREAHEEEAGLELDILVFEEHIHILLQLL